MTYLVVKSIEWLVIAPFALFFRMLGASVKMLLPKAR